jgi:HD-GYP domain-containing protein (c-di-GMP phosphodiesterase class II)
MTVAASLTRTIAARDLAAAGHAARVTTLALRLAAALDVPTGTFEALRLGAPLHDVGKLALSLQLLNKPAPLDPWELAEVRRHPVLGARLLAGVHSLRLAVGCVLHHHERWDGDGYPGRLAADAIPLEARLVAVADAYDAMTTDRAYRAALTHGAALDELERCAGTQFDPEVAGAFLGLGRRLVPV